MGVDPLNDPRARDLEHNQTCTECGAVFNSPVKSPICQMCYTIGQIKAVHHIVLWHRWGIIPEGEEMLSRMMVTGQV